MTTTILLVRHGQTKSNITGYYMGWSQEDLNETGYAQAHRLAARLASLPIAAVYTSPLRRTRSTADILARSHALEPVVSDDFIEIKLGGWQGLHADEIKLKFPEVWQQSRNDPSEVTLPGGESFRQVTERAIRGFYTVVEANRGAQAVIVTHDIIIRVLVAHVLGVTNSIYRRLEIGNGSLNIIRVDTAMSRLVTLNDTSHLDHTGL